MKKPKIIGIDRGNVVGVPVNDPDRYQHWENLDEKSDPNFDDIPPVRGETKIQRRNRKRKDGGK